MSKVISVCGQRVRSRLTRTTPAMAAFGLAAGLVLMPGTANAGFFEQLFGIQPTPAPAPEAAPTLAPRSYGYVPRRLVHRPVHRHVVAVIKSERQTPTDLMHDTTLHKGDAVMMKDGLHVYEGSDKSIHEADDFVPLDESGLSRKRRLVLASIDTTRASVTQNDNDTLASGRSAAVGAPINEGFAFTDPNGKKLRYVGP